MTGKRLMSFIALNLPRKNKTEMRMVNKGVDARTTWWNCGSSAGQCQFIVGHAPGPVTMQKVMTYGNGDEVQTEVADGDVDGVEHGKGAHDEVLLGRQSSRHLTNVASRSALTDIVIRRWRSGLLTKAPRSRAI